MTEEQFQEAFGPPIKFVPGGPQLELYDIIKGGLINSPEAARDYGYILMKADRSASMIPKDVLTASDEAGVWHIKAVDRTGKNVEILSFSRATGKLLSFINR